MSQNITERFLKFMRSNQAIKNPSKSLLTDEPAVGSRRGAFCVQAKSLASELCNVRHFLFDWRKRSLEQLMTNQDAGDLANQIGRALSQCGQLLQGLKRYAQLGEKEESLLQKHQFGVCKDLEERLKHLKRDYDKQASKYARQLKLTTYPHATPIAALHGGSAVGTSWLLPGPSISTEAIASKDLSGDDEMQQLELENTQTYLRFVSEKSEVHQLGSSISEIARLQAAVTENLLDQEEKAVRIGENLVTSSELIQKGNKKLREAMDRTKGVRFWILFIMLVLTFSLHFLEWYH